MKQKSDQNECRGLDLPSTLGYNYQKVRSLYDLHDFYSSVSQAARVLRIREAAAFRHVLNPPCQTILFQLLRKDGFCAIRNKASAHPYF